MLRTTKGNTIRYLSIVLLILLGLLSCDSTNIPKKVSIKNRADVKEQNAEISKEPVVLKFGFDLRLEPKDDFKIYMPFLKYLAEATGRKFSIVFTADYEETIKNLGTGVTQFAFLGPVNCIRAKKLYATGCLAMGRNAKGKQEYQAAIVVRAGSRLSSLVDLRGKSLAFGSRFSTQGYLIARYMLEEAGLELKDLSSYEFTGSHNNAMRAVLNGNFEAGAVQDGLARKMAASGKIKILSVSKPFPASLVCFNKNVDPLIIEEIRQALMDFDPQNRHAKMLIDWNKTEMPAGFAPYDASRLEEVKALAQQYGLL